MKCLVNFLPGLSVQDQLQSALYPLSVPISMLSLWEVQRTGTGFCSISVPHLLYLFCTKLQNFVQCTTVVVPRCSRSVYLFFEIHLESIVFNSRYDSNILLSAICRIISGVIYWNRGAQSAASPSRRACGVGPGPSVPETLCRGLVTVSRPWWP